jgi:transposase
MVRRLEQRYKRLKFTYEAGPCGYGLYRQLIAWGHDCLVAAPSLIPRRPGDRIKTDRRDAQTLARLLRIGDLPSVWVPDATHEAVRELVRCREDFLQDKRRCQQRLLSFLLRHDRRYDRRNWTREHRRWLRKQTFELADLQTTFESLYCAEQEGHQRVVQMEQRMQEALENWSLAGLVRSLMAMRGVRIITAMTLAAELGDLTRFRTPKELMAFVGLVPGQRSSGMRTVYTGITKSGNRHVRRVLVESAWSYRHKPAWTRTLLARARDASEPVRVIAWEAQKRLHRRYHRLISRGKAGQVAVTAVAREALGFIWAIGQQVKIEQRA